MEPPKYLLLSVFLLFCFGTLTTGIKTCPTALEYYNFLFNNCTDNPDAGATPTEILTRWGCTVEEITLTTDDGYKYTVIRAYTSNLDKSKKPVMMVHGIYMNSRAFLSAKEKSLVYQLVIKENRQVFLVNVRGTIYSTETTNGLTQNDYAYWQFSWHHMGINEVRITLDHIYKTTGQKAIAIGYSMGTSAISVYLTMYPAESKTKVEQFIALAPVTILNNKIRAAVARFAWAWPFFQPIAKILFNGKILGRNQMYMNFCASYPLNMLICATVVAPNYGFNYLGIDWSKRPVTAINTPDTISEGVVNHYAQLINSGKFQQIDYGAAGNQKAYNSSTPPEYNLAAISVPTTFYSANNDWLAEVFNAKTAFNLIPAAYQCGFYTVNDKPFTHDNFLNHNDQLNLINSRVVGTINDFANGICGSGAP